MRGRFLVLLRHGATDWSEDARFTSSTDVDLSERGTEQARAAARVVATSGLPWSRVISSPAKRARATADIIAAELTPAIPRTDDDRLREIDFGPFEGSTVPEIERGGFADAFARWRHRQRPLYPRGAEPFEEAAGRARAVFEEVRNNETGALLVGHGYLWRLMIACCVLDMPLGNLRRLRFDTGRFAVVEFEDEMPRLTLFNVTDLRAVASPR